MAPHNCDTSHHHVTARTPPQTRDVTATARTPRRDRHDGHSHDMTDGHDVSTTGTDVIAYSGRGCGCDRIQRNVPAHSTRHATPQANKHSSEQTFDRTHVLMLHIQQPPPWGSLPPGSKSRGRWLSSADAECSLEHFWITRYSRSLHIFSGCNRCCTLHIVYNVPWIDVDGGEASLSHINVWPSTHKGSVRILDAVRSAVRPVYPGRGLYGLVPIILGWYAILSAQPFGCRVRFPGFALGFMG